MVLSQHIRLIRLLPDHRKSSSRLLKSVERRLNIRIARRSSGGSEDNHPESILDGARSTMSFNDMGGGLACVTHIKVLCT
jgi:hypothetical protein